MTFCKSTYLIIIFLFQALFIPALSQDQGRDRSLENFDDFKLIWDRNIFNSERRPIQAASVRVVREPEKREPAESFRLLGVMINGNNTSVFFNGSSSNYSKVLSPGDSIAGFKITTAQTDMILLEGNQKKIKLSIGSGMTRDPSGVWEIASGPIQTLNATGNSNTVSGEDRDSVNNGSSESDSGGNDVLKRMMERRRQEMTQ